MRSIRIGKKSIGGKNAVFIIAEAGVNHNGRLDLALALIDAAAEAGADAVKFQTFRADDVVSSSAEMAEYQKKNLKSAKKQIAMLKELELKEEFYPILMKRARERGILFLSTPHGGFRSVDFLRSIDMPAYKIGSGDLTNTPLIEYVSRQMKPVILSTGMSVMKEVERAVYSIRKTGNRNIVLLHCTSNYPCPNKDVNLRAMTKLASLGTLIGFSDHTVGPEAAAMAVARGACVIEKHLTLNRKMKGPDHRASEEPEEFRHMVQQIRNAEIILGSDDKKPTPSERKLRIIVRKSIVVVNDIYAGDRITLQNVGIKRPGDGLAPHHLGRVLGKIAAVRLRKGSQLRMRDLT